MSGAARTGVVLVAHGAYGRPLLAAAEELVGQLDLALVEVPLACGADDVRQRIAQAAAQQDAGQGVLLLTDVCGSTTANQCLGLLAARSGWEMVGGVNLPMLIKLSTCDRGRVAAELAGELRQSAQRSIQLGSELGRKRAERGET
jgi:PTS system mannose-specific IIA component